MLVRENVMKIQMIIWMTLQNRRFQLLHKKMKFSIKDFFSKYDHLLKKSLMENFIFCAVNFTQVVLIIILIICM